MLGGGGLARECRFAVGRFAFTSRLTTSTLPVGDSTDFAMDYSQQNATLDLCVNVLVRPTRISPDDSYYYRGGVLSNTD